MNAPKGKSLHELYIRALAEAAPRTPPKKLKTITSHSGLARFLAETDPEEPIGRIKRFLGEPYSWGPTVIVYKWKGKNIFIQEPKHKYYVVYEVPSELAIMPVEED